MAHPGSRCGRVVTHHNGGRVPPSMAGGSPTRRFEGGRSSSTSGRRGARCASARCQVSSSCSGGIRALLLSPWRSARSLPPSRRRSRRACGTCSRWRFRIPPAWRSARWRCRATIVRIGGVSARQLNGMPVIRQRRRPPEMPPRRPSTGLIIAGSADVPRKRSPRGARRTTGGRTSGESAPRGTGQAHGSKAETPVSSSKERVAKSGALRHGSGRPEQRRGAAPDRGAARLRAPQARALRRGLARACRSTRSATSGGGCGNLAG